MNNPNTTALEAFGWNDSLQTAWQALEASALNTPSTSGCVPGRVIGDFGTQHSVVVSKAGEIVEASAKVSGRLVHTSEAALLPKVGDWVAVQVADDLVGSSSGTIQAVLPRSSEISRRQAGTKLQKQVVVANVDIAFLVQALDDDFSPERLQRYLFQLASENITPVIVLNKSDKTPGSKQKAKLMERFGVPIIITSALRQSGAEEISRYVKAGQTAVFLGSSGVGKSTLINLLLGEERQATGGIREQDSKGHHTTTHRELFVLKNGALIIDTPGVRELQLWGAESSLGDAFPDIEALARNCKFRDCSHTKEDGCAVLSAERDGSLPASHLRDYRMFQAELRQLATQMDDLSRQARKRRTAQSRKQPRQSNQEMHNDEED